MGIQRILVLSHTELFSRVLLVLLHNLHKLYEKLQILESVDFELWIPYSESRSRSVSDLNSKIDPIVLLSTVVMFISDKPEHWPNPWLSVIEIRAHTAISTLTKWYGIEDPLPFPLVCLQRNVFVNFTGTCCTYWAHCTTFKLFLNFCLVTGLG